MKELLHLGNPTEGFGCLHRLPVIIKSRILYGNLTPPHLALDEPPIINCHTHVFTVDDVPPKLARTIAPWPFNWIIDTRWIAGLFGWLTRIDYRIKFSSSYKQWARRIYAIRMALKRYFVLRLIKFLLIIWILASAVHDQYGSLVKPLFEKINIHRTWMDRVNDWLADSGLVILTDSWVVKAFFLIVLLILFPAGRNLLWFLLRRFNRFLKMLPGKQNTALLKRYLNIVRFANYAEQWKVYDRLVKQYPAGSKFIVLPMDMAYMQAGRPKRDYAEQMALLARIKENHEEDFFPFVFVDPRRTEAGGKTFLSYTASNGVITLGDCFIRDYIETKDFSGFKIYPALGYFPFDARLLPLWKYAADRGIPIMTHCIRGVIYYRGSKEKAWDAHPVFRQYLGPDDPGYKAQDTDYQPMLLEQMKAVDVQDIFTHPLNYACLYKKELLIQLVREHPELHAVFGYEPSTDTMQYDLSHLKLCFGHFGGEDEWLKYFEKDRSNYGHHLVQFPETGIDFVHDSRGAIRRNHDNLWHSADWYSVICSLMLQHDHVYADISYILHGDLQILPLLRSTLQHAKLKKQVLYGTDFYVVRNHKSDKNMLADIRGGLLKAEFDQIARINPVAFLKKTNNLNHTLKEPPT